MHGWLDSRPNPLRKQIHRELGDAGYEFFAVAKEDQLDFLQRESYSGLNLCPDLFQTAVSLCDRLTEPARSLQLVDTLIRDKNEGLVGHATYPSSLHAFLKRSRLSFLNKRLLFLGDSILLKFLKPILEKEQIQRFSCLAEKEFFQYRKLMIYQDAQIIINTIPESALPNGDELALWLEQFPLLEGVLDCQTLPLKSTMVLEAQEKGIPTFGGLYWQVAQAAESHRLFTGQKFSVQQIEQAYQTILHSLLNIVLIGMPGCGKTSLGKYMAKSLQREFIDTDHLIVKKAGISIPEIFSQQGEPAFRSLEQDVIEEVGKKLGLVISTGGGSLLLPSNRTALARNGRSYYIRRKLALLQQLGRPLSKDLSALQKLYKERKSIYQGFADVFIDNNRFFEYGAQQILEDFHAPICD